MHYYQAFHYDTREQNLSLGTALNLNDNNSQIW